MQHQINLLPADLRRNPVAETRGVLLKSLVIAVFVFVLSVSGWLWWMVFAMEKRLAVVQMDLTRIESRAKQVEQMRREIQQKEEEAARLMSIYNERRLWGEVLTNLDAKVPTDVWLTKLKATETGDFVIIGLASSLTSVGILQYNLNQLPDLQWAGLKRAEETTQGNKSLVTFEIVGQLAKRGDD